MKQSSSFLAVLAVFAALVLVSMPNLVDQPRLLFGEPVSAISPAFFPLLSAAGILIFSLYALARGASDAGDTTPYGARSLVLVAGLLLAAGLLFDRFGFALTTAIVALGATLAMGNRNPLSIAALSLGLPLALYWLVTRLLSTYLPLGTLLNDILSG